MDGDDDCKRKFQVPSKLIEWILTRKKRLENPL